MKRHAKKVMEMMMGPTGSILLHIIIIIALVKLVYFAAAPDEPEVEVVMMEVETVDIEELKEELEELKLEEKLNDLAPPDMSVDMEMPDVADVPDVSEPVETDFAELDVVESVKSPLVMKGLYANRSAGGRKAALGMHGGSRQTEAAVLRALEWLKNNQQPDGSWAQNAKGGGGPQAKVGYTGLALLAFLAHGESPGTGRYGPTMEKAIRFLVGGQEEEGGFLKLTGGHATVYSHGIATYAICEAYGITKIPTLRKSMNRAVEVIIKGQQKGGGYDYGFKDEGRRDTSVSGWMIQALKAAQIGGCKAEGLQECIDKAIADLHTVQGDNGFFGYSKAGGKNINNTAIAVLCHQLTGHGDSSEAKRGIKALKEATVEWDPEVAAHFCLYGWYYITQAKFHAGGGDWSKWNREFSQAFVRAQNEDGSWLSPGEAGEKQGKAYGTSLAALTLQVYYRHLPTYKRDEKAAHGAEAEEAEDEDEDEELFEVI